MKRARPRKLVGSYSAASKKREQLLKKLPPQEEVLKLREQKKDLLQALTNVLKLNLVVPDTIAKQELYYQIAEAVKKATDQ